MNELQREEVKEEFTDTVHTDARGSARRWNRRVRRRPQDLQREQVKEEFTNLDNADSHSVRRVSRPRQQVLSDLDRRIRGGQQNFHREEVKEELMQVTDTDAQNSGRRGNLRIRRRRQDLQREKGKEKLSLVGRHERSEKMLLTIKAWFAQEGLRRKKENARRYREDFRRQVMRDRMKAFESIGLRCPYEDERRRKEDALRRREDFRRLVMKDREKYLKDFILRVRINRLLLVLSKSTCWPMSPNMVKMEKIMSG